MADTKVARPKTARLERLWMELVDLFYVTPREIAEMSGLSIRRIQYGLKRARGMALDLATIWDVEWRTTPNVFNQKNQCEQHAWEEIPKGLSIGCLACLRTGLDHLIRAGAIPAPEKRVPDPPATRKEERTKRFDPKKGMAS